MGRPNNATCAACITQLLLNGEAYSNDSDKDWDWLNAQASKAARWLGYVPFERFDDRRNNAPIIHRLSKVEPEAYISIGLEVDIPDSSDLEPTAWAEGFVARQPYHFAIFGEKSSL